jgi:hypothetical protein
MSRVYVCDRCGEQKTTWHTTFVELPAPSFFGQKLNVELCEKCLNAARTLLKKFMETL